MSEIPKDIMAAAISCADGVTFGGYEQNALSIAKAIMAERERCAMIAEEFPPVITETMELPPSQYDIATAIRTPPKPSSESTP